MQNIKYICTHEKVPIKLINTIQIDKKEVIPTGPILNRRMYVYKDKTLKEA